MDLRFMIFTVRKRVISRRRMSSLPSRAEPTRRLESLAPGQRIFRLNLIPENIFYSRTFPASNHRSIQRFEIYILLIKTVMIRGDEIKGTGVAQTTKQTDRCRQDTYYESIPRNDSEK